MANMINSLKIGSNIYPFTLPYGTCSTAAATAAKTVAVDNFSLETGARVLIKFTVTNTAGSPTLNVNSTGAKSIMYRGSAISAGYLAANRVYEFVYDGTDWELIGDLDTNTTYSLSSFGVTATATELNYVDGVTSNVQTQLNGKAASSHNHAASNITSGTLSSDRLPTVPVSKGGTGATTAAGALTNLGITATAAELNKLDGVTATASEINILDGVTATTAELNYVDGVTSNIQTQLNGKAASSHSHSDYVSKSSGAVQPIMGGLVVGGSSATATGVGRIMLTGAGNPLIGLQAINSSGEQLTPYYFQVSNDIMYLGPTSAKALQFNRDGNVTMPGHATVAGNLAVVGNLAVTGTITMGGKIVATQEWVNARIAEAITTALNTSV